MFKEPIGSQNTHFHAVRVAILLPNLCNFNPGPNLLTGFALLQDSWLFHSLIIYFQKISNLFQPVVLDKLGMGWMIIVLLI